MKKNKTGKIKCSRCVKFPKSEIYHAIFKSPSEEMNYSCYVCDKCLENYVMLMERVDPDNEGEYLFKGVVKITLPLVRPKLFRWLSGDCNMALVNHELFGITPDHKHQGLSLTDPETLMPNRHEARRKKAFEDATLMMGHPMATKEFLK
jgi:hypothetical protein